MTGYPTSAHPLLNVQVMLMRFRTGDVILLDGLYGCGSDACKVQSWGVPGRRFTKPNCGHEEWRLLRRRVDTGF